MGLTTHQRFSEHVVPRYSYGRRLRVDKGKRLVIVQASVSGLPPGIQGFLSDFQSLRASVGTRQSVRTIHLIAALAQGRLEPLFSVPSQLETTTFSGRAASACWIVLSRSGLRLETRNRKNDWRARMAKEPGLPNTAMNPTTNRFAQL